MKTKYQTVVITKANLTVDGRYTDSVDLDTEFEECDGVQIFPIGTGGIPLYSVGIEDKNNTYSIVNKESYVASSSVPPNMRHKEISIPIIAGQKVEIKTEFDTALTAELKYHIEFRLRKGKNPQK